MGVVSDIYRVSAVLLGGGVFLAAVPAVAQEFAPAPLSVPPLMAPTPKAITPAPSPKSADMHVDSTELGFEKGIGPAVGRTVTYRKKTYEVTDIATPGGGPTFSGNSRFAIAPAGKSLIVGLRALESDNLAALPQSSGGSLN